MQDKGDSGRLLPQKHRVSGEALSGREEA